MTYRTIYDLAEEPPFDMEAAWIASAFILLGFVWGMMQQAKDRKLADPPKRTGVTTPRILITFGMLVALIGIGLMGWDQWRLLRHIANGEALVVEGPIQSWGTERVRTARRDKYEYDTYERFYVGDSIWFGFYRELGMAGFHNSGETRVDLRDGMLARATYLYADGTDDPPRIEKLEIAE
ncbi:MAG TPA: hypothetical protein PKY96_02200 [Flavobacteriales bacterium]|nr:hypothetical protein [Flavobacteriales bacterium]